MRRARSGRFAITTATISVFLLAAGAAGAQSPTAEELFQEARVLAEAGKYAEACPKLEESQKLDPGLGTQFNLADCYEHVNRTASAYRLFREVATIARAVGKYEREKSAKQRAEALEPKLARVALVVQASAPGLEIRIDDAIVDKAKWSEKLPLDPGRHVLRATAPNRISIEQPLVAREAATVDVTIPELVDPTPRPPPPPAAPPPSSSPQRTIAIVVGGAGVVGLGIGAVTGAMALSKNGDAESACPKATYAFRCPTQEGTDAWNSATSSGTASTIGFLAGGILVAGAAVLWFTAPKAQARVGMTPNGVRFEGSF